MRFLFCVQSQNVLFFIQPPSENSDDTDNSFHLLRNLVANIMHQIYI